LTGTDDAVDVVVVGLGNVVEVTFVIIAVAVTTVVVERG
jgi:hypothetical protein